MKYKQRPIEVEAVLLCDEKFDEVKDFLMSSNTKFHGCGLTDDNMACEGNSGNGRWGLLIETDRGVVLAIPGDYAVKDSHGKISIYNVEKFNELFEKA